MKCGHEGCNERFGLSRVSSVGYQPMEMRCSAHMDDYPADDPIAADDAPDDEGTCSEADSGE